MNEKPVNIEDQILEGESNPETVPPPPDDLPPDAPAAEPNWRPGPNDLMMFESVTLAARSEGTIRAAIKSGEVIARKRGGILFIDRDSLQKKFDPSGYARRMERENPKPTNLIEDRQSLSGPGYCNGKAASYFS